VEGIASAKAVEVAPVSETLAPQAQPVVASAPAVLPLESPAGATPFSAPTDEPPKKRHWLRRLVLASVVVLVAMWVLANIGILDIIRYWHGRDAKRAAEGAGARTVIPLTSLSDPTSEPAFSPDGSRVAFRRESFLPGVAGLYVKQVGGEELKQLTGDKNDCCPVWSPDGNWVAFSRLSDKERTIFQVSADGGEAKRLFSIAAGLEHGELDWSPDGRSIAFAGRSAEGRAAIFLLSLAGLTAQVVTMPASGEGDWGPVFSPAGDRLAFVRSVADGQENILMMPTRGGEVRVVARVSELMGPPAWTPDGESIIFGSSQQERSGLFRVPVAGGVPTAIAEASGKAWRPAASRRGFRLAFQQVQEGRSILRLDLDPPGQKPRGVVMTVSGENCGAQFSADGKKMVFTSDRLGGLDLWVSDRDGQNPMQLTAIGTAGTPRWSPDGNSVVFDVGLGKDWQQPRALFTVKADGGTPRPLVQDQFSNPAPSWSQDGKWVYFPSDRSGSWQVWKVAAEGGTPVQLTTQGGFAAWEGRDGNLYYAKNRYDAPELWRVPLGGGPEAPVYPPVRPLSWAAWTAVEKGIVYVESGPGNLPTLSFLDFSTLRISHLAVLEKNPFWLGAERDGKTVAFDQPGNAESHIVVLENFR